MYKSGMMMIQHFYGYIRKPGHQMFTRYMRTERLSQDAIRTDTMLLIPAFIKRQERDEKRVRVTKFEEYRIDRKLPGA